MTERWSYPVAQAMQRHTGCRYVKPRISPPTVPEEAPPPDRAAGPETPAKAESASDR
jgi:hypothetical protein